MPLGGISSFLPKFKTPPFPGEGIDLKIPGQDTVHATGHRKEVLQLLAKVEVIETDCIEQNRLDELAAENDEFIRLKKGMYQMVGELKLLVRQRHDIQQTKGNTVDALKKSSAINDLLAKLDGDFMKMKEVFKKQTKQRKTLGDEELDSRFQTMQVIKRQIEECRGISKSTGQLSREEVQTLTDFTSQMRRDGVDYKPEERSLMEVEKEAMARWADRDKQVDAGLEEIGDVVTRLGDLAVQIGEKADQQLKITEGLNTQANEANDELLDINASIKNIMSRGQGAGFCCKIVLALILVGQLGYLVSRFNKLIQGK